MSSESSSVPENRPAPADALLLPRTPTEAHYRRNHSPYPAVDPARWRLQVTGAVERPGEWTLADLQALGRRELRVLLECAGHRRTEFDPPVAGVPWRIGALSQADWAGAPLAALLERAGLRSAQLGPEAEVVLYGADIGPFAGLPGEYPFARSLPLGKALHPDTLLAWEMNGAPLPPEHGAPLRAVVPGWYAMDSVKWLVRIHVTAEPFRGPYQELDYRFQPEGETGIGARLAEIPVHSLILVPTEGAALPAGRTLLRGLAWCGLERVVAVEVRVDEGPWLPARLEPAGPYQAARWEAEVELPAGERLLAVRARDSAGRIQPERAPWNRRGYANNGVHRIRVVAR